MALSRDEILEYINTNQIITRNFEEKCLEPASYDIRLGTEGITSSNKKIVNIEELGYLAIEPGEFAVFTSLEFFEMPNDIVGNIGMKSKYARKGLILLVGLQIDPGFKGYLTLRMFNTSTQKIVLSYRDKIGMVQFIKLNVPAKKPYSGPYQEQLTIPPEDISHIIEAEGMTMGNVIKSLQGLITSINDLKNSQENLRKDWEKHEARMERHEKRIEWIFGIILGVLTVIFTIFTFIQ